MYLDGHLRRRVAAGSHNFLGHVIGAFQNVGWEVEICADTDTDILLSRTQPGYSLFNMMHPISENGLTFRQAYVFPFWKIESTGTRWDFECSKSKFNPIEIDPDTAKTFVSSAVKRLFGGWKRQRSNENYIYVPLQGQLLQKRGHQAMSPIDMVHQTINYHPDERVLITLHPKEKYSPDELSALDGLLGQYPNAMRSTDNPETLIPGASKIVTQNSSTAFTGLFFKKPIVLFAKSDFHHIAANVASIGAERAFNKPSPSPEQFEKYLFWFLQLNSINAGRQDVSARIL